MSHWVSRPSPRASTAQGPTTSQSLRFLPLVERTSSCPATSHPIGQGSFAVAMILPISCRVCRRSSRRVYCRLPPCSTLIPRTKLIDARRSHLWSAPAGLWLKQAIALLRTPRLVSRSQYLRTNRLA